MANTTPAVTPKAVTPEQALRLKREAEIALREADRAEGAAEEWGRRLLKEWGCKDRAAALVLLKDLKAKGRKAEAALEKAMKEFYDGDGARLGGENV